MDGVDVGGMTDGKRVNEELDVGGRATICDELNSELGSTGAEVGNEVATSSELEKLVGVTDVGSFVRVIVIVRGPVSVKPPF
jgi:hypothetical protein